MHVVKQLDDTLALSLGILCSCTPTRLTGDKMQISAVQGTAFGSAREFIGSPYEEVGLSGLFDVNSAESCRIAILSNGDDSFAARIQALRKADTSVRIQALIFTGDESGLYITELLKVKKDQGLDVRVIVDAFSNPGIQTQWMYFDLKQHGIEVEGYETFNLQWLNEMSVASHDAADRTTDGFGGHQKPEKNLHPKDHGIDSTGKGSVLAALHRIRIRTIKDQS